MYVTARLSAGASARKTPHRTRKSPRMAAMNSRSESARHVLPLHDLVVDLAEPAADHAAQQIEELQRCVWIHRQDLVERSAVDGENRRIALVRFGVRRSRFVVDERHLAEEIASIENRQRFFADAGDELRDAHAPVEDDEQLVAFLAFTKDHRSF